MVFELWMLSENLSVTAWSLRREEILNVYSDFNFRSNWCLFTNVHAQCNEVDDDNSDVTEP